MARKKVIQARVSDAETELIEAYCASKGISISGLIRELILEKAMEYRDAQVAERPEPPLVPDPTPPKRKPKGKPAAKRTTPKKDQAKEKKRLPPVVRGDNNPARLELADLFDAPRG